MKKKVAWLVALFLVIGLTPGWSICGPVDNWVDDQANSEVYYIKAGGMLLRGIHRIVESPVEIGYHTYKSTKDELGYGEGVLKGLGTGLLWTLDGAIRGAWDIVTFAFPDYHGEVGTHDLSAEIGGSGAEA